MVRDYHYHICRECFHHWGHVRPNVNTECEYDRLHLCPNCGKGPWFLRYASKGIQLEKKRIKMSGSKTEEDSFAYLL